MSTTEKLSIVEYDLLPLEVKAILDTLDEDEDSYKELSRLADELKEVGWFMDYYLNAEITELREMTIDELKLYIADKDEKAERQTRRY